MEYIRNLIRYLRRPYPQLDLSWWKMELIACGLVLMLFIIFEPFGVDYRLGLYKWVLIGGFAVVSFLCLELVRWGGPLIFGKACFEEQNWTVGKNIVYNISILLLISVGIYSYIIACFSSLGFSFPTFLTIMWNSFLIGIFPVGLITVIIENRNVAKHTREAAELNAQLTRGQQPAEEIGEPRRTVVLPDGLKGTLEIIPDHLLLAESDGNYVRVVHWVGGEWRRHTLRITMKQVEDAFSAYPFIRRCHRAYLVNLRRVQQVKGNSQGYRLVLRGWSVDVPVARSCNQMIREQLALLTEGCHSSQE